MADAVSNTYETPKWLDQAFLQTALREGLRRGSLTINTCSICPATNVGDNYLSQMFRVSANLNSKTKGAENMSVVIKSMPIGERVEKFVNEAEFFPKEKLMLSETLPLLQSILDEAGVTQQLFAKMYFQQNTPNNLLIMEDLCEGGFKTANRLQGLDFNHTKLVVECLAVFHAASLVALQRDPSIKDKYKASFWLRSNESNIKSFIPKGLKHLAERLETWDNVPSDFPDKIRKLNDQALERLFEATDMCEDELNVLTHGDAWTSNFMFKYCDNLPVDMRFVDFQLTCYSSPVYDLIYFIFSSPKNDIKVGRLDEILQCYHRKLTETCRTLNYPLKFTFDELNKSFMRRIFFGFVVSIVVCPFVSAPPTAVTNLDSYMDENKTENNEGLMYLTDFFKDGMKQVLPFFIQHGLLD